MKIGIQPALRSTILAMFIAVLAGCGGGGSSSLTSGGVSIQQIPGLVAPVAVTVSQSGDVLVIDQGLVKRYTTLGSTYVIAPTIGVNGIDTGRFSDPTAVLEDPPGTIFVVDAGTDSVSVFKTVNGVYTLSGSFGSQGSGAGQFLQPVSIAEDALGDLYVADTSNSNVQEFKPSGSTYTYFANVVSGFFSSPDAVAIDQGNNILVADKTAKKIYVFSSASQFATTIGSSGTGAGQFSDPASIATDAFGSVYVADPVNFAVSKFTANGSSYSYSRKVGSTAPTLFSYTTPISVGVGGTGVVAVLDSTTNEVTVYPSGV